MKYIYCSAGVVVNEASIKPELFAWKENYYCASPITIPVPTGRARFEHFLQPV